MYFCVCVSREEHFLSWYTDACTPMESTQKVRERNYAVCCPGVSGSFLACEALPSLSSLQGSALWKRGPGWEYVFVFCASFFLCPNLSRS